MLNELEAIRVRKLKEQDGKVVRKDKKARRRRIKRVLLGLTLMGLSFTLFLAVYVLRLDAWHAFDDSLILEAPRSLLLYDAHGEFVSCLAGAETRIPISLGKIPTYVQRAFISAEDARFYDHMGVDIKRIFGAAWEDVKAGAYVQGASTISQQLIKLSHLSNEKVMTRKMEEAVLAYQMEQRYSKDEILEMYLNYVYFGGGFYGVEAAAQGYFGRSASELTLAQGAMLAGILKSPSRYAPHLHMDNSLKRRNLVLGLMRDYGYIDAETCEEARREEVVLTNDLKKNRRGYYVDLALEQACEVLNVSMDELLNGGYRLHTAMDVNLQQHCEEIMKDGELFPEQAQNAEAALVVVDVTTGGVAALMGGRESTTALAFNRATRIRRQPGSVIKPIIAYAPALEEAGYTTVSMILDQPTDFGGYTPSNFGSKYKGWVTMREAAAQSLNVPAVKVLENIGVEAGKEFAQQLGIEFDEKDTSLTLALGGFTYGVSPYQIAGAYAAFAAGGEYSTPTLVLHIENTKGETLYMYEPEKKRVMSEANAYILTDMLKSAIQGGTGRRLNEVGIELAGKTGTTGDSEGNRDAWMAAYNPEYAAAVWMGYDDASDGNALPAEATGGSFPALILKSVFTMLYEEKSAPVFAKPDNIVEIKLDKYTLDSDHMAVLANALTPAASVTREVFVAGTEPVLTSEYWVVPTPPMFFSVRIGENSLPEVWFKPNQSFILYRLYREDSRGNATMLNEWLGGVEDIRYADLAAMPGESYAYYVIPAHPQLKIGGQQLLGPATRKQTLRVPSNPFLSTVILYAG